MKCLKVEDYVKRTASSHETRILREELENYVRNGPGLEGRTLCDRVIRSCNQQLGAGPLATEHLDSLMGLVEIALRGYESVTLPGIQSDPVYMEKILFHILKKTGALGSHTWCQFLGNLLYDRLARATVTDDYHLLVRNCFTVLWGDLTGAQGTVSLTSPGCRISGEMKALRFLLLLLEGDLQAHSKVTMYAEDAMARYTKACGVLREDSGNHLLEQIRCHLLRPQSQGGARSGSQSWPTLCEVTLHACRHLCKAGLWDLAVGHLDGVAGCAGQVPSGFRSPSVKLSHQERHTVLQGCQLVTWVLEAGQNMALGGTALLAWFSFQEEHQKLLQKHIQESTALQMKQNSALQHALCYSFLQGLNNAFDSLAGSQLEEGETLERVLLYCQATAGRLMNEVQKLADDGSTFIKAASTVNRLVCGLYNRKLYNQAFSLVEILCQELQKNSHLSLPVEKLNRAFMLAVQTSRRGGELERALDWVVHWLRALGDRLLDNMVEPVSLWAKTKADAARVGQEDTRLRTLRDGLGPDTLEDCVMTRLLEEELHAYRELAGDTAQERYNTLCDLLEICQQGGARAVYLCEMAQVVCFQDFSMQTDCSAADFTQEALRLLEEEPETTENSDTLKDDKAQASLWFYICTLEKNLQEAIKVEARLDEVREQQPGSCLEPLGTNDMDYEHKQKQQCSQHVYQSLCFNLTAESKQCQSLDMAFELWRDLLAGGTMPAVRGTKRTISSIMLMGALYKMMGKPLQALESYQLVVRLSRGAGDSQGCATAMCHAVRLLLELGAPELAQLQLEQVEELLQPGNSSTKEQTPLDLQAVLLRAHLCHAMGQVEVGVPLLSQVLKEVGEHRQSKTWYLLQARALQMASAYLHLDVFALPHSLRQIILDHGLKTADTALYESLKLLCSLVLTLVGNGFYGASSTGVDSCFVDQGENVLLKWQLLSEVLSCSQGMVAVRSHSGAVHEAKVQCLEALKLATKLQTVSQCGEFLVMKAELELQRGELEQSGMDLEHVKGLLDRCTDFTSKAEKAEVKIKPRKGRPPKNPPLASPTEEDYSSILSTRTLHLEPVEMAEEWGLYASPPLKAKPQTWLSFLDHAAQCDCPCCSEPMLGRVVVRWAVAQAELTRRLCQDGGERQSHRLFLAALSRSKAATAKLGARLEKLTPAKVETPPPSFLHDLTAQIYLRMALSGLEFRSAKAGSAWDLLDSGLAFVGSRCSPELVSIRGRLQAAKALVSVLALASKRGCQADELFSPLWAWNPAAKPKDQAKPLPSVKEAKEPNKPCTTQKAKKAKDPAVATTVVPKLKITLPSAKSKGTKITAVAKAPKSLSTPRDETYVFDFNSEVPQIAVSFHSPAAVCTPTQKVQLAPLERRRPAKPGPKHQFQVYDESSTAQSKPRPVPDAPKRSKRSRFKVVFSDESDVESDATASAGPMRPRSTAAALPKPYPEPPAPKAGPKRPGRVKKGTALPPDSTLPPGAVPRRGRSKNPDVAAQDPISVDEPERMRTIEEVEEKLEMSMEELRASDTEGQEAQAGGPQDVLDINFEVLRREPAMHWQIEGLGEIRRGGHSGILPPHQMLPNMEPGGLSLDVVRRLLSDVLVSLQHLPPPGLYPQLCGLLALCHGQSDPITTAMLHAQSLGVTTRHHMTRHLATKLGKLRKKPVAVPDLAAKLKSLSIDDSSAQRSQQCLARLESIFSFPTVEPTAFPEQQGQEFTQQLCNIPAGVTVCLLSVVSEQLGDMGDTVLLTRLESGAPPITVRIPTSQRECPISAVLQEMDCVQKQQKVVSSVADKAQWWDGRRALDQRMERLLEEMSKILGGWQGLLLPLTSDPELSTHVKAVHQALTEGGARITEETLKAVLSASPFLSAQDLHSLAGGLCPGRMEESLAALQGAVLVLKDRAEPQGHVVLVLDKYLQKLPWENILCLISRTVTRMPSLHFLLGHCALRELEPDCVLNRGVDPQKVFYVLNPDANLKDTEERFKDWFTSEAAWQGVCGTAPSPEQLQEAVATKDLYIYVGHGAGARFLDSRRLLKQELKAAALLFGCSSAALAVNGELEGVGVIINYLMAGCPLVLGNLWDVTDRDIDRFTKALLQSWLSAGRGAALLDHMASSRQATYLKHLIGAAPVVYGLPICLK
ncbi:hypothetical protein AAFF_G00224670 [Aldrovandia affinis]|uniref:separase n=1 Tax=Aldrovandia affinis TaxID=143900 RepID=A0AAD7TAY5_9TELE|nr:hypothetical protein AAFF_G00224670 [Aldrovandia affinis]